MQNNSYYENYYTFEERKQLIANSLKILREYKKMTQSEVAEQIGINTQTYSTYERGRNEAPAEVLVRLSFLYDVPLDIIMQKENLSKEKEYVFKQLGEFEKILDEFKGKVLSGDKETRKELERLGDAIEKILGLLNEASKKI